MRRGIIDRILYKYEYLGEASKDGQIYKKYKKVSRLGDDKKLLRKLLYPIVFIVGMVIAIFLLQIILDTTRKTPHGIWMRK